MTILKIHTDGACSGNQHKTNIGGWGAVLEFAGREKELWGGEENTTNNRMEMLALLSAFRALKRDSLTIQVFSDSAYLMDCFRKGWYKKWQKNGWLTSQKKPVGNRDLWEALLPFLKTNDICFYRVKGHVDLDKASTDAEALFRQFRGWNGNAFTYEEFLHAIEMNNRVDALANRGMDEIRAAH